MDRRKFVGAAGLAGTAGLLGACGNKTGAATECESTTVTESFEWKMVTALPKNLPGPGVAAQKLAYRIEALSGGRIEVKLFAAGELVPNRIAAMIEHQLVRSVEQAGRAEQQRLIGAINQGFI